MALSWLIWTYDHSIKKKSEKEIVHNTHARTPDAPIDGWWDESMLKRRAAKRREKKTCTQNIIKDGPYNG